MREDGNLIGPDVRLGKDVKLGTGNVLQGKIIIEDGTRLGHSNVIEAVGLIEIGRDNFFGHHNALKGNVRIGSRNHFENFVSIGSAGENPSNRWEHKEDLYTRNVKIEIGDDNIIKEFVTIQYPLLSGTVILNNVYVMSHSHVAHDVKLHDGVIISTNCTLGGHCVCLPGANIGLSTTTHPRTTVGAFCMVAMGSVVTKDIPPFLTYIDGQLPKVNAVGIERGGGGATENDVISFYQTGKTGNDFVLRHFGEFQKSRFPEKSIWEVGTEFRMSSKK
jgi:UDP-N-acetylglucosamine acyltransferase